MKKNILEHLQAEKELQKHIKNIGTGYDTSMFLRDAKDWIDALKSRRMLCIIESVSKSGMSRVMKFHSCEKAKSGFYYRQYWCFMQALGYSKLKDSDGFRINGCGMDMVFATNYNIIHDLKRFGIITKEQCAHLAQQTPTKL